MGDNSENGKAGGVLPQAEQGDEAARAEHAPVLDQDESSDAVDEQTLLMIEAVRQRMPFGKFKGSLLLDLPEPYVVWFKQRGFPKGKLGAQMALVYEIKLNGLEKVFRPLTRSEPRQESEDSNHQA